MQKDKKTEKKQNSVNTQATNKTMAHGTKQTLYKQKLDNKMLKRRNLYQEHR